MLENPIKEETTSEQSKRLFREAKSLPLPLFSNRRMESWKIRVLKQGYCLIISKDEGEPAKCNYCLIDHPYTCKYRISDTELVWRQVFGLELFSSKKVSKV